MIELSDLAIAAMDDPGGYLDAAQERLWPIDL
jgi:hypothetical protein